MQSFWIPLTTSFYLILKENISCVAPVNADMSTYEGVRPTPPVPSLFRPSSPLPPQPIPGTRAASAAKIFPRSSSAQHEYDVPASVSNAPNSRDPHAAVANHRDARHVSHHAYHHRNSVPIHSAGYFRRKCTKVGCLHVVHRIALLSFLLNYSA
jgi:hypothetical protein